MLTRLRLLSLSALLILINAGSVALAHPMVSFATGGYATQLRTPEMMDMIDANADHVVSRSEWDAYQERLFMMLDADKSGAVDNTEFMSKETTPMASFATGGFATALKTSDMWTRIDADKNGEISHEEFLSYQGQIFDMMDTTNTGKLTQTHFFGRGEGNR